MSSNRVTIVKLNFHTGVHIGRGLTNDYSGSEGILRSDTISGALASAYAQLTDNKDLLSFINLFRVSSAFPFFNDRCFFPKPMFKLPLDGDYILQQGLSKLIKRIEFIEKSVFEKIINQENLTPTKEQLKGSFWFANSEETPEVLARTLQQRVTVPRDGGLSATPYYVEKIFFAKDGGLFFIIDAKKEVMVDIEKCLNYLAYQGFGTDKSVGNGSFNYEISDLELKLPQNPSKQMLLSLWCPKEEEVSSSLLEGSSYQLVKRGGFIAGSIHDRFKHLRKKSIYMFTESTVLPDLPIVGKIVDIAPDWNDPLMHPVFRDGRCFCLPVKTD